MRRNFLFFVCTVTILMTISCKKNNDNNQSDCQKNNYGIFKVTFGSNNIKHEIIVTIGSGLRDKENETGILSDTLHLKPGIYPNPD